MKNRRFKVQRRVKITARDLNNRKFLLTESWHTVVGADEQDVAKAALDQLRRNKPKREFRLISESPAGRQMDIIEDWRSAPGRIGGTEPMRGA